MSREQIYKAELEKQYAADCVHPRDSLVACDCCIARRFRLSAVLEAAAKVGDDAFVCNAVCCDDSHPDHAQELRRLLAEAEAPPPAGNMNAIDAYLRGAR